VEPDSWLRLSLGEKAGRPQSDSASVYATDRR
jgi:hypothetical protein